VSDTCHIWDRLQLIGTPDIYVSRGVIIVAELCPVVLFFHQAWDTVLEMSRQLFSDAHPVRVSIVSAKTNFVQTVCEVRYRSIALTNYRGTLNLSQFFCNGHSPRCGRIIGT